jgi:hypothetical protein
MHRDGIQLYEKNSSYNFTQQRKRQRDSSRRSRKEDAVERRGIYQLLPLKTLQQNVAVKPSSSGLAGCAMKGSNNWLARSQDRQAQKQSHRISTYDNKIHRLSSHHHQLQKKRERNNSRSGALKPNHAPRPLTRLANSKAANAYQAPN